MDPDVVHHQQELEAAGARIDAIQQKGDARAAAQLRKTHERVQGDFARMRRAFADDWHRMRKDAEAGLRELKDEMASVDTVMIGWHDEEVRTLDQSLDEVTSELEQLRADDVASKERRRAVDERGVAEVRAQIDEAKKRRAAIAAAPPEQQKAAVDSYSAAVQDVLESWRRLS
jgi:hypothetical protein